MNKIVEFQLINHLKPDGVVGPKTAKCLKEKLHIQTDIQLAHFLGQCHVESVGFTVLFENLNYTEKRLLEIFRNDFDQNHDRKYSPEEIAKAKSLAHKPEAIANFVYANQNGNGNESSGDGWKHRGVGLIQLTGKTMQEAFFVSIGLPKNSDPNLIGTTYYFESALFFFKKKNIWALCKDTSTATITIVSKRVNGGTNGLKERIAWTKKYYNLITGK